MKIKVFVMLIVAFMISTNPIVNAGQKIKSIDTTYKHITKVQEFDAEPHFMSTFIECDQTFSVKNIYVTTDYGHKANYFAAHLDNFPVLQHMMKGDWDYGHGITLSDQNVLIGNQGGARYLHTIGEDLLTRMTINPSYWLPGNATLKFEGTWDESEDWTGDNLQLFIETIIETGFEAICTINTVQHMPD